MTHELWILHAKLKSAEFAIARCHIMKIKDDKYVEARTVAIKELQQYQLENFNNA